jgi:hypothetical protein
MAMQSGAGELSLARFEGRRRGLHHHDGRVFGQGRKPVFCRLFFALGSDEQPFQRVGRRNLPFTRSRPDPWDREAAQMLSVDCTPTTKPLVVPPGRYSR